MAGEVDPYLSDHGRMRQKGRRSVDHVRLQTLTIFGDEIPSKAFNYGG